MSFLIIIFLIFIWIIYFQKFQNFKLQKKSIFDFFNNFKKKLKIIFSKKVGMSDWAINVIGIEEISLGSDKLPEPTKYRNNVTEKDAKSIVKEQMSSHISRNFKNKFKETSSDLTSNSSMSQLPYLKTSKIFFEDENKILCLQKEHSEDERSVEFELMDLKEFTERLASYNELEDRRKI